LSPKFRLNFWTSLAPLVILKSMRS
jgi:hypothetical protein